MENYNPDVPQDNEEKSKMTIEQIVLQFVLANMESRPPLHDSRTFEAACAVADDKYDFKTGDSMAICKAELEKLQEKKTKKSKPAKYTRPISTSDALEEWEKRQPE